MRLASLQTTKARWAADAADRAWREHKMHCPGCDLAARRRRWDALCRKGAELHADRTATATALARSRELDKEPAPDQERLF